MHQDKLQQLLGFLAEDPNDAFTRYAIAMEYYKRGELAEAAGYFQELVHQRPDYVGTYYHYGKLKEEQEEWEVAAELYQQGITQARQQQDYKNLEELQEALALVSEDAFEPDDDEFDV
jgi:tetratricopeptide (TPR) repeat protein